MGWAESPKIGSGLRCRGRRGRRLRTLLHMWMQIVGKTRLALTPLQNHWWNVPLYVTAHGLGTSAMACGDDVLDIEFDFVAHALHLRLGSGMERSIKLRPQTVADFYKHYLACLADLGVDVKIMPDAGGGAESDPL